MLFFLLHLINDNLEQQAQALFFEYFGRTSCDDLPKDWSVVTLGDVAVICNKCFNPAKEPETMLEHYSIPAFDEARFPVFELSTNIKSNKFKIDSNCFMISKLNPTTKRVWKPYCLTGQAVCSTEFIVYKAKDPNNTDFLYSLIDSDGFSAFMCSHVKDLNLSVKTRVVRRQYNLQEPWKTVLELSTTLRELGDSSAQWDKAADVLASTDVIDRQEVKDLVPFNHLRNSRADSGMNYWTNSGFEVDAENGVSGTASFKAEGVLGMTKSLTQTVYPASRRSYTFSAQIASEDLQKGPSGQVGIEVTFEYEDGSTETRFIDLF